MLLSSSGRNPANYRMLPMPTCRNDGVLRDYQMEGFNRLVSCRFNNQGCILADEMGHGKTIQAVSYINELYMVQKILGPFVVVAPLSTYTHWQLEVQSWTDLDVIIYQGCKASRDVIQEHEWSYGTPQTETPLKCQVVITSYEILQEEANAEQNPLEVGGGRSGTSPEEFRV